MGICKQAIMLTMTVVGCLGVAAMALGEDDAGGKGKGKGKGEAPAGKVIQIDLSQLPPDLAKALAKYASKGTPTAKATQAPSKGKAAAPMAKGKAPAPAAQAKGYMGGKALPPGLANKPVNHPGRTHYIEHVLGGKDPTRKGPATKAPGKGKGKGSEEEED